MYYLRNPDREAGKAGRTTTRVSGVRETDEAGVECSGNRTVVVQQGEFMKKPKTQQQLDRATDLRLQRSYGITLADYNKLLLAGDGKCWICKSPPGARRLHVDHDHSWKKAGINAEREETGGWTLWAIYEGENYLCSAPKKADAKRCLLEKLKRASVRGLLCSWCNRGLRFYHDSAESLMRAHEYIEEFGWGNTAKILERPLTGQETK